MQSREFDEITKNTFKQCQSVLEDKAQQYAPIDRHANFKMCARMRNREPEQALIDMWMKHLTWLLKSVDNLPENCDTIKQWDERIIDTINYMVLLRGLVMERLDIPVKIHKPIINFNLIDKEKKVRSEIIEFAIEMEKKMAANDYKPGWRHYSQSYLAGKLVEEVAELLLAIEDGQSENSIIQEAADVGNFAMMIADVVAEKIKRENRNAE